MKYVKTNLALAMIIAVLLSFVGCSESINTIKLGTAADGGIYNTFGEAFASIAKENNIKLAVKQTTGSGANMRLIADWYIDMALVQANDVSDGNIDNSNIKVISDLYYEACHVIVRKDSNINSIDDLEDKTISVGELESGTEKCAKQILSVYGLSDELLTIENYDPEESAKLLEQKKIDAFFYMVSTNNEVIRNIAQQTEIKILDIDERHSERLSKIHNCYTDYTIPQDTYSGQKTAVHTVGLKSLLVVNGNLSTNVVYSLTKLLFDYKDKLAQECGLSILDMDNKGIVIPFHEGAIKYFNEHGIKVS